MNYNCLLNEYKKQTWDISYYKRYKDSYGRIWEDHGSNPSDEPCFNDGCCHWSNCVVPIVVFAIFGKGMVSC